MTAGAKPKPVTMRLEAGTPITGTVKFVDFYAEKPNPDKPGTTFSAQWAFTGDFDGAYGKVYIDTYQLEENPVQCGLVEQAGSWPDGNPKFKWTGKGPVALTKYLKDKKAHVRITPANAGAGVVAPATGNGAPAGQSFVAAPVSVPAYDKWSELERNYKKAAAIAGTVWPEFSDQALVAAAATVFIEANKRGLTVPLTATEQAVAIRDTFDALPAALQDGAPDPELPAWMQ